MNTLSSIKVEIKNYFDSLINQVDIDIEKCLGKYNKEQLLSQLDFFGMGKRSLNNVSIVSLDFNDSTKPIRKQTVDKWPESTKVVDYLNQIRKRTVDQLTKAHEETLEHLQFKTNGHEEKIDELRSEIFKEKFYFQVHYEPNKWIFNLFTFVADFYMSPTEIDLLEKFINSSQNLPYLIFDEKMVLIGLLVTHFFDNLNNQKFPSHVISVRKQDTLNIKKILCNCINKVNLNAKTIDLSNLERLYLNGIKPTEMKIEGLCSLETLGLKFHSLDKVKLRNLLSLRDLSLDLEEPITSEVLLKLVNKSLPNIEVLNLSGKFSFFRLDGDSFSNLKRVTLFGILLDEFNLGLFNNLCNRLEDIIIGCANMDDEFLAKLFYGRNFPYLRSLCISGTTITKLEKKLFYRFATLQKLMISFNRELQIIDHDAFSNLTHLNSLYIRNNCIESIDSRLFSRLVNLESLNLSNNRLIVIKKSLFSNLHNLNILCLSDNYLGLLDPKSFVGLDNLKNLDVRGNRLRHFDLDILDNIPHIEEIDLSGNTIFNKEEIINRLLSSKIKLNL